ncbi:MAG: hypothetical protein QOF49_646 [Chloroflexota bacterium]|jgi:hypothetical protein|nr:hypothetical protein [Chloroflexota bacterium]
MHTFARTDRRPPSILIGLLVAGIVVGIAACGASAAATAPPQGAPAAPFPGASSGAVGADGSKVGGVGQVAVVDDTKSVRTGSLQVTVADPDAAVIAARDTVRGLGGYIGASQAQRTNDEIVASVTYRIPVARWEDALDAIRRLGTETGEQTNAVEVTGQLVDLAARIRNLRASELALVGYVEKAAKTSDLLEIEARLTDTRGQIEQLSAQQASLADQAAMGTLTVAFGTELVAVTQAAAKWNPAAEVDQATAMLIAVGQGLASFLIVFAIVWLPILAGLAVLGFVGLTIARRLGWRRSVDLPPVGPVA